MLAFNVEEPNHNLFECLRWIASCLTEEVETLATKSLAPPAFDEQDTGYCCAGPICCLEIFSSRLTK